jgi:hypothetical protein
MAYSSANARRASGAKRYSTYFSMFLDHSLKDQLDYFRGQLGGNPIGNCRIAPSLYDRLLTRVVDKFQGIRAFVPTDLPRQLKSLRKQGKQLPIDYVNLVAKPLQVHGTISPRNDISP